MRLPRSAKKLLCTSVLLALGATSTELAAQDTSSAIRGADIMRDFASTVPRLSGTVQSELCEGLASTGVF